MLISLNLTNLIAGYDAIKSFELTLRQQWRHPLLENYTKQTEKFEATQTLYQKKIRQRTIFLSSGFLISLIMIVSSIGLLSTTITNSTIQKQATSFVCLVPILCISGIGLAILLASSLFFAPAPKAPLPPSHPYAEAQKSIFPDLTELWWQGLAVPFKLEQSDEGIIGEALLIQELLKIQERQLILHRLIQKEGDDLDVVVIGKRGLWLFEVKYWKGAIDHLNGEWQQKKTYRGPGGREKINQRIVENHPDHQWHRMKEELLLTFQKNLARNTLRYESIKINGGVLFAHPQSKINIPKGSGFSWGNLSFWLDQYHHAPADRIFQNDRNILLLTEVLLERHQRVTNIINLRSMTDYAETLFSQANEQIKTYLKESGMN